MSLVSHSVNGSKTLNRKPILPVVEPRFSPITRMLISVGGLIAVIAIALFLSRLANDPLRFPVTNVDVLGTLDSTPTEKTCSCVSNNTPMMDSTAWTLI